MVDQFRMGKVWVLIATELMSRGIDFKGVNLVINYDFPQARLPEMRPKCTRDLTDVSCLRRRCHTFTGSGARAARAGRAAPSLSSPRPTYRRLLLCMLVSRSTCRPRLAACHSCAPSRT